MKRYKQTSIGMRGDQDGAWVMAVEAELTIAEAVKAERSRICAAIKAEDDYCVDNNDYMLDSNDCISVVQGTWKRPNA